MTTFLQYLCERLMGGPARPGGSAGESYWCCPFHNDTSPSFHTLPHKPGYKDRWCCFGCGARGDEADLVKAFYPGEDWPRRRARLGQWRQEYEAALAAGTLGAPAQAPTPSSFRGGGGHTCPHPENAYGRPAIEDEFCPASNEIVAELMESLGRLDSAAYRAAWRLCETALALCARYGLHPDGLARRCHFEAWQDETDEMALREDPDPAFRATLAAHRRTRGRHWPDDFGAPARREVGDG